jgi:Protein phosphatase 2C
MGTYLSTPVTDKSTESGESLKTSSVPCRWGVVDQQGWRKSMEDAHIAVTDLPLPAPPPPDDEDDNNVDTMVSSSADAKVFGVFDGHGGAEVARFCQLYLVSVLTQQPTWTTSGNGEGLGRLPTSPDDPSIPSDPDDLDQAAKTPVGMALRSTFHALDRMIDDPTRRYVICSKCVTCHDVLRSQIILLALTSIFHFFCFCFLINTCNRQEILQLRNMKPQLGERREATSIPPEVDTSSIVPPPFYLVRPASVSASASAPEEKETDKAEENDNEKENENETAADDDKESTVDSATEATTSADSDITAAADDENDNQEDNSEAPEASEAQDSEEGDCDDDSEQAVGLEEAAEQDRDTMMDDDDDNDDDNNDDEANSSGVIVEELDVSEGPNSTKTEEKVTTMFQKILALGTTSGQIVVSSGNDDDSKSKTQRAEQGVTASSTGATLSPPVANMSAGPDARVPTVSHNGRMVSFSQVGIFCEISLQFEVL